MSKIRLKYYKSQAYQSNTTLTEHLLEEQRKIDTDHLNVEQPEPKQFFLILHAIFQLIFKFLFLCQTFAAINLNRLDIRK